MAYSAEEWAVVKAFYEEGLSLSQIIQREEVAIKDRATISRKAKAEGWEKGKNATLLNEEVSLKQKAVAISEQKATLNATELGIHNTLVAERVKYIQFFNNATVKNLSVMLTKIKPETIDPKTKQVTDPGSTIADHRIAQAAIKDGRETVLGKDQPAPVQIVDNSEAGGKWVIVVPGVE